MAIEINDGKELKSLLEAMASEMVDANIFLRLRADLLAVQQEYSKELRQSRTFWSLTLQAHLETAVFYLCRIFDQHADGLNLRNLLETIKANIGLFDVPNFRERLKGNVFVESLAADAQRPDMQQLEQDIQFAGTGNPIVKSLVIHRNNFFAHRSAAQVIESSDLQGKYPLTEAQIQCLLEGGMQIVNRYSVLFHAQSYSTQIVGHDDYQTVLSAVRLDLQRRRREIEDQCCRVTGLDVPGPKEG